MPGDGWLPLFSGGGEITHNLDLGLLTGLQLHTRRRNVYP